MARLLHRGCIGEQGEAGPIMGKTRLVARLLLIPLLLALLSLPQPFARANVNQGEGKLYLPAVQVEVVRTGKILYEDSEPKIFVVAANGGNPTELSAGIAGLTIARSPAWSPDNTQIAFSAQLGDAEDLDIWVMSANGTDHHPLTSDPAPENMPAWSPDKSRIAFLRTQEVRTNGTVLDDLFVMNADGSQQTNVTTHPAMYYSLDWSPDSSKIVFVRAEADSGDLDVFVMDAGGSNLKKLSDNPGPDDAPTWSSDGSRIAFSSKQGLSPLRPRQIYAVNVDGSGLTNLTQSSTDDHDAAWSPDGNTIAYLTFREFNGNITRFIYLMDADGSHQRKLPVPEGPVQYRALSWSPDNQHIAFIGYWPDPDPMGGILVRDDISVIDVTGSNLERLTFGQYPLHPFWSH